MTTGLEDVWGDPESPKSAKWKGLVRIVETKRANSTARYVVELWSGFNGFQEGWVAATWEDDVDTARAKAEYYFDTLKRKRTPNPTISSAVIEQ